MQIKKITYREYRQIANSFIKQIGFHCKTDLPLDIELMLEKAGHQIIPLYNLYSDYGIKGIVIKKIDGFDIAIDNNHYMNEEFYFRFTLAEELAHILVHPHIYEVLDTIEDVIEFTNKISDEEYRKMEQQAKSLASCLLFPDYLFDEYILQFCSEHLKELKETTFYSKDDLGGYISEKTYRKLLVSTHVIRRIILNRYPDLAVA